jgi:hypothetical protein
MYDVYKQVLGRCNCMQIFILFHPVFWPQFTAAHSFTGQSEVKKELGGVSQWYSACLAYMMHWD